MQSCFIHSSVLNLMTMVMELFLYVVMLCYAMLYYVTVTHSVHNRFWIVPMTSKSVGLVFVHGCDVSEERRDLTGLFIHIWETVGKLEREILKIKLICSEMVFYLRYATLSCCQQVQADWVFPEHFPLKKEKKQHISIFYMIYKNTPHSSPFTNEFLPLLS